MMALTATNAPRLPLAEVLAGFVAGDVPDVEVARVALDSRAVQPQTLFLACRGTQVHGLDYAADAIARGASVIAWDDAAAPAFDVPTIHVPNLVERAGAIAARAFGHPAERLFVAGVTGTDGKTSCAWLLARALDVMDMRCGYLGTLGYGLPDDLAEASHTTPDPAVVQDWLSRLDAAGARAVALEVSSHGLAQYRVDGVAFDVAVLTQIGRDHLDYHGDEASYAAAKQRLFQFEGLGYAVLNADDAHGRAWLATLNAQTTPVVYGYSDDLAGLAEYYVRIESVSARADGLAIELDTRWGSTRIDSVLIGRFNATNLAAVLAVLLLRGVSIDGVGQILGRIGTVPGRMERIATRVDQPLVVVDYAHTANALQHALRAVREHAGQYVFCVFGCGGDRDRGKRALMGAVAAREADRVWLTDDNPRNENPAAIVADIRSGMMGRTPAEIIHDRAAAIAAAIRAAGAKDVVLIAGKGHETTQQIGSARRAFDDRIAARRALEVS